MSEDGAPNHPDSQHSLLRRFVEEHPDGGPERAQDLLDVLWQINAPADLQSFGWVTTQLSVWVGHTIEYAMGDHFRRQKELSVRAGVVEADKLCEEGLAFRTKLIWWIDWYLEHFSEVNTILHPEFAHGPDKKNVSTKSIVQNDDRHGLYCLLLRELLDENWIGLCERYLYAHARVLRRWPQKEYLSYTGKKESGEITYTIRLRALDLGKLRGEMANRVLPALTVEEIWASDLDHKLKGAISYEHWIARRETDDVVLPSGEPESEFEAVARRLGLILRFCDAVRAWDTSRFQKRGAGTKRSNTGKRSVSGLGRGYLEVDELRYRLDQEIDQDDPCEPDVVREVYGVRSDAMLSGEYGASDLCEDEFEDPDSFISERAIKDETEGRTLPLLTPLAARGRMKHVSMAAQFFPWQSDQLSYAQVKALLTYCERRRSAFIGLSAGELDRRVKKGELTKRDELECSLLLPLIIFTGSNTERAASIRELRKKLADSISHDLAFYLGEDQDEEDDLTDSNPVQISFYKKAEFRFQALTPDYKSSPTYEQGACRALSGFFWLPDFYGQSEKLQEYRQKHSPNRKKTEVFQRWSAASRDKVQEYEARLRKFLKVFAESDFRGEGVTLRRCEMFLFKLLAHELGDAALAAIVTGTAHRSANVRVFYTSPKIGKLKSKYVEVMNQLKDRCDLQYVGSSWALEDPKSAGARFCVKTDAIQLAVQKLQGAVRQAWPYSTRREFVLFHNLYTLYTVWLFGFATGARAINSPVILSDAIDDAGRTTCADKDRTPPYHARLMWLPPTVQTHLDAYSDYFRSVEPWLRLESGRETDDLTCCFIQLDKSNQFKLQDVVPSTIEERLGPFIRMPANGHRRYLRTELLERESANSEHVDALLGHWNCGEEPWSHWSSFQFNSYLQDMRKRLETVLSNLSFEAVEFPEKAKAS